MSSNKSTKRSKQFSHEIVFVGKCKKNDENFQCNHYFDFDQIKYSKNMIQSELNIKCSRTYVKNINKKSMMCTPSSSSTPAIVAASIEPDVASISLSTPSRKMLSYSNLSASPSFNDKRFRSPTTESLLSSFDLTQTNDDSNQSINSLNTPSTPSTPTKSLFINSPSVYEKRPKSFESNRSTHWIRSTERLSLSAPAAFGRRENNSMAIPSSFAPLACSSAKYRQTKFTNKTYQMPPKSHYNGASAATDNGLLYESIHNDEPSTKMTKGNECTTPKSSGKKKSWRSLLSKLQMCQNNSDDN